MWFWIIWGTIGIFWEIYAIITKESKYLFGMQIITLSRTVWRLCTFEDRTYDRHEKRIRIIFMILYLVAFGWGAVHLGWGPCAFDIC